MAGRPGAALRGGGGPARADPRPGGARGAAGRVGHGGHAPSSRASCSAPSARPACSGSPTPRSMGGGGQPYEVYLQVLEELRCRLGRPGGRRQRAHAVLLPGRPVGIADEQRARSCPTCSAATCSAPTACPRRTPAPMPRRCRPRRCSTATTTSSTAPKAWVTHGGHADFYNLMVRTSGDGPVGHLLPARRRRHPGTAAAAAREEDGHALRAHRHHRPRRRPGAGRPADRPGGPRASRSR